MKRRLDSFRRIYGNNWVVGKKLLPLMEQWGRTECGTVLDLGCGESPFQGYFSRAARYIRMDQVAWDDGVVLMDGRAIPLASGSVDTVLLSQVLGDVPEPGAFLFEVARVLRPGGRLLVFETTAYPEHDLPHDYYRIMPEGLRLLGQQAGLQCMEMVRFRGLFARFTMLWNSYLMGRLAEVPGLGLLARAGVVVANLVALPLDSVLRHPTLAPDYAALLVKR